MKTIKITSLITSVLITAGVLCNLNTSNAYALSTTLNNSILKSSKLSESYLKSQDDDTEWYLLTKARTKEISQEEITYWTDLIQSEFEDIDSLSVTEIAKYTMVLSALGIDASNYTVNNTGETINALTYMMNKCTKPDSVWVSPYALMALNSYSFANPSTSTVCTADDIVNAFVNGQLENGTWNGTWGPDGHGVVMVALSYYKDRENVKQVLDKAAEYAINTIPADSVWGGNSCSSAFMIWGLSSAGYDLESNTRLRGTENINSLDALLRYQITDRSNEDYGAFYWMYQQDKGSFIVSTEESWYALAQAVGGSEHKIFDFKDNWTIDSVTLDKLDTNPESISLNAKTNTVSWNIINNASSYKVYLNNELLNTTSDLSYTITDLSQRITDDSKLQIVGISSDGSYISKYVLGAADIISAYAQINNSGEQSTSPSSSSSANTSSASYNITDSHNITYTSSPSITNSPYCISSVGNNSTVINMGSIYGSTQDSTVTSTYTVTDSNGRTTTTSTTVGHASSN